MLDAIDTNAVGDYIQSLASGHESYEYECMRKLEN